MVQMRLALRSIAEPQLPKETATCEACFSSMTPCSQASSSSVIGETSRYLYPAVGPCFSGNSVTTGKRKDKIHLTSGARLSLRENRSNQGPVGFAMRNYL